MPNPEQDAPQFGQSSLIDTVNLDDMVDLLSEGALPDTDDIRDKYPQILEEIKPRFRNARLLSAFVAKADSAIAHYKISPERLSRAKQILAFINGSLAQLEYEQRIIEVAHSSAWEATMETLYSPHERAQRNTSGDPEHPISPQMVVKANQRTKRVKENFLSGIALVLYGNLGRAEDEIKEWQRENPNFIPQN